MKISALEAAASAATAAAEVAAAAEANPTMKTVPFQPILNAALSSCICDRRGVYWAMAAPAPGTGERGDSDATVLPPVPSSLPAVSAESALEPYASPLLVLKSYRLNPLYRQQSRLKLSSRTYANKIDPFKRLCPFELHGVCRDSNCPDLHERDIQLSDSDTVKVRV